MNKLIRELAEQATSYTWNGNDVTEELDEQKFAELIVRECADVVSARRMSMRTPSKIASEIKEHFGVEE